MPHLRDFFLSRRWETTNAVNPTGCPSGFSVLTFRPKVRMHHESIVGMQRKKLSSALLALAAWVLTILALLAVLEIVTILFLAPGVHVWRMEIIMTAVFTLLSILFAKNSEMVL